MKIFVKAFFVLSLLQWPCAILADNTKTFSNQALEQWRSFAEQSKNPQHKRWLAEIEKPDAIRLANEWKILRGYDSYDILKKYKLPETLKPGLTVDAKNIANYPWLKEYMPLEMYKALASGTGYVKQISIVPTNTYYMNKGVLKATQLMHEKRLKPFTDENNTLRNPGGKATFLTSESAGAIPYLHPENGLELNWSFIAHGVGSETLILDPMVTYSCSGDGQIDYKYKAALWWQKFHGRSEIGDLTDIDGKEGVVEAGAIFAFEPYDVNGFAGVRQRYADGSKSDDFKVFLPAMRRTRTLSGADAQDPMWAGLEVTWDDWRSYWVKTNQSKFEYNLIGERLILASPEVGYVYDSGDFDESSCSWNSLELELRPVWQLEIIDKTGSYQYKKRTLYIDMEMFYSQFQVTTDQRDNKFRTWEDSRAWRPFDGDAQWRHVTIHNEINDRVNYFFMTPQWDGRADDVTDEQFDIDQLRDYQ
jgi:hypothetical protein